MSFGASRVRQKLKSFDFRGLFIEELGWDHHQAKPLEIERDGMTFVLQGVAQKRGMVAYLCGPDPAGAIPDYATRRKIDKQVTKVSREHIVIYTDAAKVNQKWQWVRREPERPDAYREQAFHKDQPGDALIQKLQIIAFSLDEEDRLALVHVIDRNRQAFDVERVTKRFYDRFKAEHERFLKFIKGIQEQGNREWYASLMLNRLMFIYFIQQQKFLDDDQDYLHNRLRRLQRERGKDKFHSFYRYFLLRLFHEGLGKPDRNEELDALLGKVPYLNGGLFEVHQLEANNSEIQIPDEAFERIFTFFKSYDWTLEPRLPEYYQLNPGAKEEINPDVLGYIFEKYINQKQMGAYYTKEDITEYIAKNTVLPYLFDAAEKKCAIAFHKDGAVWQLLRDDPDRYIYAPMREGIDLPLPKEIAAGLDDVSKRQGWNRPADSRYALPTETWREHAARRQRCQELRAKLMAGEIHTINDFVTYNLDIRRFAEDVIKECEGPELLRAFYYTIAGRVPKKSNEVYQPGMSILDPTCGSGAFLFAALNILEPLYDACLERMQSFVSDLELSGAKHSPEKFADFRDVLGEVAKHPNRTYFILKSIIVNNLYGVDIMEEAVEICKLRLFLKLVVQVEKFQHLEPLPDIDFNIRAGNTLVGFVDLNDVKRSMKGDWTKERELPSIEEEAEIADRAFHCFHEMQTVHGMDADDFKDAKVNLRSRFSVLRDKLDELLAAEYGVDSNETKKFHSWRRSHQPFHWFVEFYGIVRRGGFNAIIGNPPYVELSDVRDQYSTLGFAMTQTGNLFSICAERFSNLTTLNGRLGIIVPVSAVSTPRMLPLMKLLIRQHAPLHISNFAVRPGKLFVGVDMNLSIIVGCKCAPSRNGRPALFSTRYNRWRIEYRPFLFPNLRFAASELIENLSSIPKMGECLETALLHKVMAHVRLERHESDSAGAERIFYHSGGRYFRKCLRERLSNEYKELKVGKGWGNPLISLLSSSFYYWFWIAISDCYHVTRRDIDGLPAPVSLRDDKQLDLLATRLLQDLWKNAEKRTRQRADGTHKEETNFDVGKSKYIIDDIDRVLARHFNLSSEELDFLINRDIAFRGEDSDA